MDNLPVLKVIDTRRLVLHEEVDPKRVARLQHIIVRAKEFTNPPIVTPLGKTGDYVVLDGANRSTVFRILKYPHVIAQVVPYAMPHVRLTTWNHFVEGAASAHLLRLIGRIGGVSVRSSSLRRARQALRRGEIPAFAVSGRRVWSLETGRSFTSHAQALDSIVRLYKGRYDFSRVLSDDWSALKREYPRGQLLFVFRTFREADIIRLVQQKLVVPSGITRHLVQGRVLRLDLPMSFLRQRRSRSQKQKFLDRMIEQRVADHHVRFYNESVYIYND
jgi:hypothetical protein